MDQIDQNSISDHDSHIVSDALVGLAALLGWYTLQLSALAPALATPAAAAGIFADLAPAFAAAATGGLLADALSELDELDNDDDNDPTNTQDSTVVSSTKASTEASTETSTATSTTAFTSCSALPYTPSIPDEIDEDNADNFKRSSAGRVQLEERGILEREPNGSLSSETATPRMESSLRSLATRAPRRLWELKAVPMEAVVPTKTTTATWQSGLTASSHAIP